MAVCNNTIEEHGDSLVSKEEPLFGNVTFHHLGLAISAAFGLVAVIIATFLIIQHARHYSKPWEQKHIIRILLMIPIYAIVSFLSYLFYKYAIYWEVIRDCYEAFAIASFFTLLCHYLEPTLHEQKNYFRQLAPRNWVLPVNWMQKCTGGRDRGPFRVPRSGLTWFNIVWVGVFQYCAIRVIFTFVALISQFFKRYCESSLSPAFAHIWVEIFESVAVCFAMYFLIQFYIQLKTDLAPHKPFLKIACIKLVIFFSFWQSLIISFLGSAHGPLQPTAKIAYPDINTGIPSMLLCIEMALFAVLHLFAFPYKPYDLSSPLNAGNPHVRYHGFFYALLDSFNPWDVIKACARSMRWVVVGYKKRQEDESYNMKTTRPNESADDVRYPGPTFAGNGEPAMDFSKPRPSGTGSDGKEHDDMAGLLSNAQSNPTHPPDLRRHHAYQPGGNTDLALTQTTSSYDEYGSSYPPSYPPSYAPSMTGNDPSPYRYEAPPRIHTSQVNSSGSSPVVVSPMVDQQAHMGPAGTAAYPFAGINRPAYATDEDYEHVDTGYHAVTTAPSSRPPPGQGAGGEWNMWSGAGAPHR